MAMVLILILSLGLLSPQNSSTLPFNQVIREFVARESAARRAQADYDFEAEITIQELDRGGSAVGEFRLVAANTLDKKGKRQLKSSSGPSSTLQKIGVTPDDIQSIFGIQPFAVTTENVQNYDIQLFGDETVKGAPCYVVEVKPRRLEKGQLYFQGKIWIDKDDFHVVKTVGKSVPDKQTKGEENIFATFETTRVKVDEYWFPGSMQSRETLPFSSGPVDVRSVVTFRKYRKP
jgi:hypothetical protein